MPPKTDKPTIDTSAFASFGAPKTDRSINLGAFGGGTITPVRQTATPKPQGVIRKFASAAPAAIGGVTKEYLAKEQAKNLNTFEQFKDTFIKKPAAIVKFIAQGTAAFPVSLGRSVMEAVATPIGKKDSVRKQFNDSKVDDALFGGPVETYQQMTQKLQGFLDESPDATNVEKRFLAPVLGLALFAADAYPGKPSTKKLASKLFEEIAATTDAVAIEKQLIDFGTTPEIAQTLAPRLVNAKTNDEVRQTIMNESGDQLANLMRVAEDLPAPGQTANTPEVPVTAQAIDAPQPTLAQTASRTADDLAIKLDQMYTEREILKDVIQTSPARQLQKFLGRGDNTLAQIQKNAETRGGRSQDLDSMVTELGFRDLDEAQIAVDQYRENKARLFNIDQEIRTGKAYQKRAENYARTADDFDTNYYEQTIVNDMGEVDVPAVRDLIRRDLRSLRPTTARGDLTKRNLKREIELNIENYNTKIPDDEIVRIREQNLLNPESIDEIIVRKRGIITDAMAIERAKKIQGTLNDVIELPKGTLVTKEQYTALEQMVQNEREINKALQIAFDQGGPTGGVVEQRLLARSNPEYANKTEQEILRLALQESTMKLKKAEIVLLGIRAETGRTLQGMKQYVEGVDNRLRILFNLIDKNKKLDEPAKKALVEQITKLDTRDNKKFLATLDELMKPDWFNKVAEWSVAAKLWNPTTHIVNLGGNALRQLADIGIKTVTNPMAARADMAGAMHGFKLGLRNAMEIFTNDGYARQMSKYIETGGAAPAIKGKFGTFARTPFRALAAGDEIFRNMAYQRKLYRDAYTIARKEKLPAGQMERRMEELLNAPTFTMQEAATKEAKRMTFQEDMGEIVSKINRFRDPKSYSSAPGKAVGVTVRFFLPFLKTPTNLFKQGVDLSPFGLIKNFSELKAAAKAGDQEKVGTILGEAILGTAFIAYIAMEASDGNVTGGTPSNPAARDRFYREKKLPYAIKVGETWYQYQRLDPFALIMGMTADIANGDDLSAGSLIGTAAQNLQDKTYLSGVSDLMKLMTGEDWERDYSFKSALLGAAFPSFVGHIARSTDPVVRMTDSIGERLLAQTPGMSQDLPARVNNLGYNVERANKGLNYFFNPVQTQSAMIDPVTRELMTIDKSISVPNKNFQRGGVKYDLNASEYEDFARYTGTKLRMGILELRKTPRYQNATTEDKGAMIDTLRGKVMDEWKDEYVKRAESRAARVNRVRAALQASE